VSVGRRRHVVPVEIFDALASGGGGEHAVRLLAAAQRSKRMLLIKAVADRAGVRDRHAATDPARVLKLLAAVQAASPDAARAVEGVLAYPSVSGWAHAAMRSLIAGSQPVAEPAYLATVAAAAAVHARVGADVPVPARDGRVVLPSLGAAELSSAEPEGTAIVRSRPDGAAVETSGHRVAIPLDGSAPPGWAPLRFLRASAAGLRLHAALDDIDQFSFPPTVDSARRVAVADAGRWQRTVGEAWWLLAERHRGAAAEIGAVLQALVPIEAPPGGHASSTSRDAFGSVAMSEPASGPACAVTLVHEVQHAKLGALLDLVPLVDDPGAARWYAPWRDDPRPLTPLLQGAYAFLGITGFWRRQRVLEQRPVDAAHAHTEFARWRAGAWTAVETLRSSGGLTLAGQRFVAGMEGTLAGWRTEPVPDEPAERAHAAATRHRRDWLMRNGDPAAQLPSGPGRAE
jgi:HEXXH motif-containing protein